MYNAGNYSFRHTHILAKFQNLHNRLLPTVTLYLDKFAYQRFGSSCLVCSGGTVSVVLSDLFLDNH